MCKDCISKALSLGDFEVSYVNHRDRRIDYGLGVADCSKTGAISGFLRLNI